MHALTISFVKKYCDQTLFQVSINKCLWDLKPDDRRTTKYWTLKDVKLRLGIDFLKFCSKFLRADCSYFTTFF